MNLKSRKLIASATVFGSATLLMFMGKMTSPEWMEASLMVLTVYVGGNALEHIGIGLGRNKK